MALSPRETAKRRQQRTRTRLRKLANGRARLSVFRSDKNIYAQVIDDQQGVTIAAASSLGGKGSTTDAAAEVGRRIAEAALAKGVKDVVFDRGRYVYHGRVKALADAAREAGLNF